jgi:hypothetical protein
MTVGNGNEGHPCHLKATKYGFCSFHFQVEFGHFYGGYRSRQKSEVCLNCGEPKTGFSIDSYCRAKPAARKLTGGEGARRYSRRQTAEEGEDFRVGEMKRAEVNVNFTKPRVIKTN